MRSSHTTVFVGPTLYGLEVEPWPDEKWEGPACRGDIYFETANRPKQIVLIDGRFDTVFSVWHKEILFALHKGIRVIGAASMGAIRAAEMWHWGMIGVGEIFETYKRGACEDDAWVAMSYDAETNRPLTEAPCGQELKQRDALQALELARELSGVPFIKPDFSEQQINGIIKPVLERMIYG
jgi:hypothetical protein